MKYKKICISVFTAAAFLGTALSGCSDLNSPTPEQVNRIQTFLNGIDPPVDYSRSGDSFFFIAGNDYPPSVTPASVNEGDSIYIYYTGCVFDSSRAGAIGGLFITNHPYHIEVMEVTPGGIYTGIYGVKVGSTPLVGNMSEILTHCHEGDSIMVYMPSTDAYGDSHFGAIPPNTIITYIFKIEEVVQ